jgi:hypothetical protein
MSWLGSNASLFCQQIWHKLFPISSMKKIYFKLIGECTALASFLLFTFYILPRPEEMKEYYYA